MLVAQTLGGFRRARATLVTEPRRVSRKKKQHPMPLSIRRPHFHFNIGLKASYFFFLIILLRLSFLFTGIHFAAYYRKKKKKNAVSQRPRQRRKNATLYTVAPGHRGYHRHSWRRRRGEDRAKTESDSLGRGLPHFCGLRFYTARPLSRVLSLPSPAPLHTLYFSLSLSFFS